MRHLLFLLLTISLCTGGRAQTPEPAGRTTPKSAPVEVGIQSQETIDALMAYIPGVGSPHGELARQSIKSYMMPIRKAPNAHTEWAYVLTAALEYYHNLNNNFKDNLSPDYLYLSLTGRGTKPNLEDGLRLLMEQGTVSASIVPYGSTVIPGAVYSVPKTRISNFGYLFRPTTKERNCLYEIKKALTRGNPVIVEMATSAAFASAEPETSVGGEEVHFVAVTGYDTQSETVEVRGNFGRAWGRGGYLQLSFREFAAMARSGYVLIPSPDRVP